MTAGWRVSLLHRRLEAALAMRLKMTSGVTPAVDPTAGEGLFFVIGHGRSGTNWLADLLNHAANAEVEHEPYQLDIVAAPRARVDRAFAERYTTQLRVPYFKSKVRPGRVYGEVNSRLRHMLVFLQEHLPRARSLRIFRDGRDVVRSSVGRHDIPYHRLVLRRHTALLGDDPFFPELFDFDDFALTCWLWQRDCKAQAAAIPEWIDFQRMTNSAAYVHEAIVAPLGLELPEAEIERRLSSRLNSTRAHVMPDWHGWSEAEHRQFWRICGDAMRAHGIDGP